MFTFKKIFRFLLLCLGVLLLAVIIFCIAVLLPVDRASFKEKKSYSVMMSRLDSLKLIEIAKPAGTITVGFAKENLTPSFRTATAGYGNRLGKKFTSVYDSIYVRSMVINNGVEKVAIVSADLLIIPPTVTSLLESRLQTIGFSLSNTYLNATHTHNSIGNWGEGATKFIYGAYNDSIVSFIADKIVNSIATASANQLPSKLKAGSIVVPGIIRNRIDKKNGTVDSTMNVIEVTRKNNEKLVVVSYNAHATCLFSRDLQLSRDYPGELVDELEANGYDFAMFLSGAVGSHGTNPPEFGKPCIHYVANILASNVIKVQPRLKALTDSAIRMVRVPLELGEPQVKISEDWRIRPWVFRAAFGDYTPYLTGLRIGNVLLLGTPCDFSGELTGAIRRQANEKGFHSFVTSFNGHYIGYITADKYYDYAHYETRLMNWYGPGNGEYMTECLLKLSQPLMQ